MATIAFAQAVARSWGEVESFLTHLTPNQAYSEKDLFDEHRILENL